MLPDRTTTIGEGESVATERPFQSIKAVDRTRAKLRTWVRSCRGCSVFNADNMAVSLASLKEECRCDRFGSSAQGTPRGSKGLRR